MAGGVAGTQVHGDDTVPARRWRQWQRSGRLQRQRGARVR
ncbi:hypothetical protein C731_2631 [Mycolicibacterium hassiacum DSM 44199]|uniref:Uncharacterized protein n=1 Tax=Mycolicibacterium hassiacum (strain DSM 44199 / CIP 105218 / JCM 12690 / 3849) TaxID=1122247 RepID=K5BB51_MYCHD|nr:hypothetical protein C731_2631 [Mycolicibacterium hassiacum DSM 44199]